MSASKEALERRREKAKAYQKTEGGRRNQRRFYEKHRERLSEENKAKRRPTTFDGWIKRLRTKTSVLASGRKAQGLDAGGTISTDVITSLLSAAHEAGDISFSNPISAPSPDRINNARGYHDDNIQIVPMWLNYAYHDWDKDEVEAEILEWAARRLAT